MTQPLDHFDGTTNVTFEQRYFLSMDWYKSGAAKRNKTEDGREIVPVILYDGGETSLKNRAEMLNNGIVAILANATGGIAVLLEHRYYGTSTPIRSELGPGKDWGVDQLRWLNTRQSLEDSAAFVRRMQFQGVSENAEFRVIYYGGSYAGARAAFMRTLYPDLIHGAIASSAVVAASVTLPEYYYAVARGSDTQCSQALQSAVNAIDKIIAPVPEAGSNQTHINNTQAEALKSLFGLAHAPSLNDFANFLTLPLGMFQSLTWVPDDSDVDMWNEFCTTLTNATAIEGVKQKHSYELGVLGPMPSSVLGLAAYMEENMASYCEERSCTTQDVERFRNDNGTLTTSKAWQFQVCNEYGYYQVAPPIANVTSFSPQPSGPKIVSWRIDEQWMSLMCREGFTRGEHWTIPPRPDVSVVNRIGNMGLDSKRLAIIDGQYDPWRPMTQHSEEYAYGGVREDTIETPFKLIPDCWHHCDSSGLADPSKEPPRIREIHDAQIAFVQHWLQE
ncbi:hypothetical protein MBRA1_001825 [Malassezia brasiliensis]|uniref:Uncharacterized protein n=1 Tax=Malassezia brasiliensis TaxID=1821822 RepID=A0AAF0ISP9_9BASI|nr:hypothetical protein MBRA1_001825 [Malassezia brasiliensis]